MDNSAIYDAVQEHYSAVAQAQKQSSDGQIAKHFGYDSQDLTTIPAEANLGLSCGNPLAIATLKPGETVIDLGCGAGFDVFLAARKVGADGMAIGIDQNDDMLAKASLNKDRANVQNVRFIKSSITDVKILDACADCIISNCVINLVPEGEKGRVFKEMLRMLKPGGRVAISDILAKKTLPDEVRNNMALYVGCIAGASQIDQYETHLLSAGFTGVTISDTKKSINVYDSPEMVGESCCATSCTTSVRASDIDFDAWAGSFDIFAAKPNGDT